MQRAHERIILDLTWRDRTTMKWIRQKTKVKDILETINKLHCQDDRQLMNTTYNILDTMRINKKLISINDSGTERHKIEICGRTWGRPISNKGLSKAEMMMMIIPLSFGIGMSSVDDF